MTLLVWLRCHFFHLYFLFSALPSMSCSKYTCLFSGFNDRDVQEDVAVHGEQETFSVRVDLRGGDPKSSWRELRFPNGVYDAGLHRPEGLQSHPDRRVAGHQGIRHCHAYGYKSTPMLFWSPYTHYHSIWLYGEPLACVFYLVFPYSEPKTLGNAQFTSNIFVNFIYHTITYMRPILILCVDNFIQTDTILIWGEVMTVKSF